jgi:hypothetical protein
MGEGERGKLTACLICQSINIAMIKMTKQRDITNNFKK